MRLRFAAILGLSVLTLSSMGATALQLPGAIKPQVLLSERVEDAATADPRPHVPLHIVNGFSAQEEANIIAAVVDWNRTSWIRLDVAALNFNRVEPKAWSISNARGNQSPAAINAEPLVISHVNSAESGSIVVNADHMAGGELRSVIAHEFAKVFGTRLLALSPNGTVISR